MTECIDCGIEIHKDDIRCYDCDLKEYNDWINAINGSDLNESEDTNEK